MTSDLKLSTSRNVARTGFHFGISQVYAPKFTFNDHVSRSINYFRKVKNHAAYLMKTMMPTDPMSCSRTFHVSKMIFFCSSFSCTAGWLKCEGKRSTSTRPPLSVTIRDDGSLFLMTSSASRSLLGWALPMSGMITILHPWVYQLNGKLNLTFRAVRKTQQIVDPADLRLNKSAREIPLHNPKANSWENSW